MLYEKYYQKILKVKRKRDFIYRYRYWFISLWTGITVISGSLFSLKGYVANETFFSPTIIYGETYQPSGSALFDDVVYEYATIDSDLWQTTSPKYVGDYKVRGKSENNFGEYYYGQTFHFSIIPKPVALNFQEIAILYGQKPTLKADLVYTDEVAYYDVIYDDFATRDTFISVDLSTFQIINEFGEDVTFCYEVSTEKQSLGLMPRPLTITFNGDTKVYDGLPIFNDAYTIVGSFAFEDYYVIGPSMNQTNLGQTLNRRDIEIYNQNNENVTHLYDLRFDVGTLSVVARPLTISSQSLTKVYDGNPFPEASFSPIYDASLLLPGHELMTTFTQQETFVKTQTANNFTYFIQDAEGEVVTSLYDLTIFYGSFDILPRPITLTTNSAQKVYDSFPFSEPTYVITAGELALTDTIESTCTATLTSAGKITNACTYEITHATGEDVKSSYTLTPIAGELMIDKRPITIQIEPLTKTYDGILMVGDQYTYSGSLVEGDSIQFKTPPTTLRNVGKVNNAVQFEIVNIDNIDVSNNYNITVLGAQGALEITKRPLAVQSETKSQDYNATNLSASGFMITSGSLADGEDFIVRSSPTQKNVGVRNNIQEYVIEDRITKAVVTANYDLTYTPGQLTVNQTSSLTLISKDFSKTYDDVSYVSTSTLLVDLYKDGPFTSEILTLSAVRLTSSLLNVGSDVINIDPNSIVIRNNLNEIVTNNYAINLINAGLLTINPRDLGLTMNSLNRVYDGQPLTAQNAFRIDSGTLAVGHQLVFSNPQVVSITNVNQGPVSTNTIVDVLKQGQSVKSNYNVSLTEGSLNLTRRRIQITTSKHEKIYDGTPLRYTPTASITSRTGAPFNELPLATGHTLHPTFNYFEPVNVSDNGTNFATFKILDANQVDVTENYDFIDNVVYRDITIIPRPIQVALITSLSIYDGTEKGYQIANMSVTATSSPVFIRTGTLPQGFSLKTGVDTRLTQAGSKSLELVNPEFFDGQNNLVSFSNFELSTFGAVTIFQREITIITYGGDKIYDGTAYSFITEINFGQLAPGDIIEYEPLPPIIERGTYTLFIIVRSIRNSLGQDVTNNYKINRIEGVVTIT
jgi:hypothetical protein